MRFHRNLFFPLRLMLYPFLLAIILVVNGTFTSNWFWVLYTIASTLLLVEAIWESAVPYATINGFVIEINSSLISKKRIDLTEHRSSDVEIADWHVQIGNHYINLRKIRAGHRDRLAELLQDYFEPQHSEEKSAIR